VYVIIKKIDLLLKGIFSAVKAVIELMHPYSCFSRLFSRFGKNADFKL